VNPLRDVVDKALESRQYQMWLFTAFGAGAVELLDQNQG